MKKVYDLNLILKRFYNVTEDYDEWKKLIFTFQNAVTLINLIKTKITTKDIQSDFLQKILLFDNTWIQKLIKILLETLELDVANKEIKVKYGIDEELDLNRNLLENLQEILEEYTQLENSKLTKPIDGLKFCFFP